MFHGGNCMDVFDAHGKRLYCTDEERKAFRDAAAKAQREVRTFCLVLCYTGCRITEALELAPGSIDLAARVIVFRSLKKRKDKKSYRAVPVPPALLDTLNLVHNLQMRQRQPGKDYAPVLWSFSRTTAWRKVQDVMDAAGIADGPHKCPLGLRHGFAALKPRRSTPTRPAPSSTAWPPACGRARREGLL